MNDLLGNLLRVLQQAGITPTANRYDDLADALNKLYQGPSSDAGNVLVSGTDGKALLTDAAVKQHQTVTQQSWDAVNKVLTFTNEAGQTLTVNLAAVDAHLAGATLQAGVLVLQGTDGEPDVQIDLTAFLQAVSASSGLGITVSGTGTAQSPLQVSVALDPIDGNLLRAGQNGLSVRVEAADVAGLADVATSGSYNDLRDLPAAAAASLPGFQIEPGNTSQGNFGRGIDMGNYYQLDMSLGNSLNGLSVEFNDDKTMNLPFGTYLVVGSANIVADSEDTFQSPIQMVFSAGFLGFGFPGIYQYSAQYFPPPPVSTVTQGGELGYLSFSSVVRIANPVAVCFSKIVGPGGVALRLQGNLAFLKIA
ncbi:hypothetical protein AAGS40_23155 [Paraburkholderia sp. PREW-6R]|uniref:hypothetical protein n=1 Tax=Paraburkholderia sp. PREW-6R TaxID=3141544 RepID=UPI0031F4864C